MTSDKHTPFFAFRLSSAALSTALLLGACSPTDATSAKEPASTQAPVATTATPAQTSEPLAAADTSGDAASEADAAFASPSAMIEALKKISSGYKGIENKWPGFDPSEHPVVLPYKTDTNVVAALVINHPSPDQIGDATKLDIGDLPFASAYRVESINDEESKILSDMPAFEFHANLGGVDSFAMNVIDGDVFFDVLSDDYTATLLHEMFHRYQDEAFDGDIGFQDVDGYAYTPENLELAALEDRALASGLNATTDADRMTAAQHFVAIRQARMAADPRVVLDNSQEMFEGTARWIEHSTEGEGVNFVYNSENYARDLSVDIDDVAVKETFGFGRFYASGAAIVRMAELLGVADIGLSIEKGMYPADVLATATGVSPDDVAALVEQAQELYDPAGELRPAAEKAAQAAQSESNPFGDSGSSDGVHGPDGPDDEGEVVSDEQMACLVEQGVVLETSEITDEQWEACVES